MCARLNYSCVWKTGFFCTQNSTTFSISMEKHEKLTLISWQNNNYGILNWLGLWLELLWHLSPFKKHGDMVRWGWIYQHFEVLPTEQGCFQRCILDSKARSILWYIQNYWHLRNCCNFVAFYEGLHAMKNSHLKWECYWWEILRAGRPICKDWRFNDFKKL